MKYATFHPDGTLHQRLIKDLHVIPKEAIEVDADLWPRLISEVGCDWVLDANREIVKQPTPTPKPTREDVERLRLAAYAEPVLGSDRYFSEANRMQVMGEIGWESVREAGIARFNQIQIQHPWPKKKTSRH